MTHSFDAWFSLNSIAQCCVATREPETRTRNNVRSLIICSNIVLSVALPELDPPGDRLSTRRHTNSGVRTHPSYKSTVELKRGADRKPPLQLNLPGSSGAAVAVAAGEGSGKGDSTGGAGARKHAEALATPPAFAHTPISREFQPLSARSILDDDELEVWEEGARCAAFFKSTLKNLAKQNDQNKSFEL